MTVLGELWCWKPSKPRTGVQEGEVSHKIPLRMDRMNLTNIKLIQVDIKLYVRRRKKFDDR